MYGAAFFLPFLFIFLFFWGGEGGKMKMGGNGFLVLDKRRPPPIPDSTQMGHFTPDSVHGGSLRHKHDTGTRV